MSLTKLYVCKYFCSCTYQAVAAAEEVVIARTAIQSCGGFKALQRVISIATSQTLISAAETCIQKVIA